MKVNLNMNKTISKDIFSGCKNMWEVLPNISKFILELGKTLDSNKFNKVGEDIWIAKDAVIDDSAKINGPCIIDEGAVLRQCAFIRGSVIVGKNAVIGNSSELKNSIIFDECQIPHFNYVGDSILGYKAHLAAGCIVTNLKLDKKNIVVDGKDTGLRKMGAIIGECVDVGSNSVIYPGTIIGSNTLVYPLTRVRGIIEENSIIKDANVIVRRK